MSRNYNRVILIGTVESEKALNLRKTKNNTPVTNFTVTTCDSWEQNGEVKSHKKWHHIVCWGKLAEYVVDNFIYGDDVLIEGAISYRNYEKDNKNLKVAEIKATSVTRWEGSLNRVILVGNIGNELELRKTTSNASVTNFSLSTIEKWKNREGIAQSNKRWHRTVCWGKIAENAVEYVKSGSLVLIEGSISYRTYINRDNVKNNHIAEVKASALTKWADPITDLKEKK